jgi:hypothetical protein
MKGMETQRSEKVGMGCNKNTGEGINLRNPFLSTISEEEEKIDAGKYKLLEAEC